MNQTLQPPVDFPQLSLIPRSPCQHGGLVVWQEVEDESVSSGAGWALSPGGIPSRSPPDRFDESPLPLYSGRKSRSFNQTHHCSIFPRSLRRTEGHFTNKRRDISTSTPAQLTLTGCRWDLSFCSVDKVNWIQSRKYSDLLFWNTNTPQWGNTTNAWNN